MEDTRTKKKQDFINCLNSMIENADKIFEEYGFDVSITAVIKITPDSCPTYIVQKEVLPKESLHIY